MRTLLATILASVIVMVPAVGGTAQAAGPETATTNATIMARDKISLETRGIL